ncbi:MAG: DUF2182 domain-containing protein [Gemmatimonadota bacterium]|nr:DUF2182 domain-containing protein [Gemmatimonadota bacterium]MDE2870859.1 DUF2182 domain-containing protein [Gemmatimonadota bacterium]
MNPVPYPAALAMWLAMTGVMMAPILLPWLRALRRLAPPREAAAGRRRTVLVTYFAAGYAAAWAAFSAAAAGLQVSLAALEIPVPFGLDAPAFTASALMLAGGFQFTPFKAACLSRCRSPAGYLLARWRGGASGHLRMGLGHGLDCVGCCWALMALALVVGMAGLVWMGLLMAVMVGETTLPRGSRITRPIGAALITAGAVVLVGA